MKKLIAVLFVAFSSITLADSTYEEVKGVTVTQLRASSAPLAGIAAWANSTVSISPQPVYQNVDCTLKLNIDNAEHSVLRELSQSKDNQSKGLEARLNLIIEDTFPGIRTQPCWIRAVSRIQ